MTKTSRKAAEQRLYLDAEDAFTSEGGAPPRAAQGSALPAHAPSEIPNAPRDAPNVPRERQAVPRERQALMTELSITYDGRHYRYDRYRYDRLADAVRYARLRRSRPATSDEPDPLPPMEPIALPTESQRELMAMLAITFDEGVYRRGAFRYDRLADAVDYARRGGRQP